MKFKVVTTWMCMVALLCISSYGYGASGAVSVTPSGISFSDNSVQTKAAVLPVCSSGEVIVNSGLDIWACGTILPVDKGIATCVSSLCAMSACQPTWGNCDGNVANGCEASLATTQNCGACGNVCGANSICSAGTCVVSPNSPLNLTISGSPAAGFINNQRPVTVTANVQQVAGGPVPAGTIVNFSITGGSGGLSSATAATNASGNASVTLNSTVEGNVTVTATAAPVTNSAVISFTNPNKPGSVVLGASPATGVTNNVIPVTLTATVAPADIVNGTIANGTVVNFNIVSGTGTLSSATATTTNGVASVTLNSTVAGSVGISASAGTSPIVTSNTANVPFTVQPTTAVIKLSTTGTLQPSTLIGGINALVTYPTNKGLSFASIVATAPGAGVNSLQSVNPTVAGKINVAIINTGPTFVGDTTGITQVGAFDTITLNIAPGNFPVPADFTTLPNGVSLTGSGIIDTNSVTLSPGINVAITSVTIQ